MAPSKPEQSAALLPEAHLDVAGIYAQNAHFLWQSLARAGVARISHGPFPWKLAMTALKDAAAAAYAGG